MAHTLTPSHPGLSNAGNSDSIRAVHHQPNDFIVSMIREFLAETVWPHLAVGQLSLIGRVRSKRVMEMLEKQHVSISHDSSAFWRSDSFGLHLAILDG